MRMVTMCQSHQLHSVMSYYAALFSLFFTFCVVHAAQEEEHGSGTGDILSAMSSSRVAIAGVLSMVVLLLLVVVLVAGCMDCMNAEVSSDNHPACASTAPSWSGATDYYMPSSVGGQNPHFASRDFLNPSVNHSEPVPYPMTPFHVPEQAGFTGYQHMSGSGRGEGGMVGYGATGIAVESPPPYSETG